MSRQSYDKRKKIGLCIHCGKFSAIKNKTLCIKCQEQGLMMFKKWKKELREKRKKEFLCIDCGKNPPKNNRVRCTECCSKESQRQIERCDRRKSEGICVSCGKLPAIYRKTLCFKCLSKENERGRNKALKNKYKVIEEYGGKCSCCGEDNPIFLSIDHINNDGYEHRKKDGSKGVGGGLYVWLIKHNFPKDRFQLLCHNCNFGKHINGGICPHQTQTKKLWVVNNV